MDTGIREALNRMTPAEVAALAQTSDSPAMREKEWLECQNDIHYFLRNHVRTINFHREATVLGGVPKVTIDPFPDFPHTNLMIDAYVAPQLLLIEKSRDMMLSWVMASIFLWDVMFNEEAVPMFMTTYRERLVDDGGANSTANSLMGRVRLMYEQFPPWMIDRAGLRFSMNRISNPTTKSFISGYKSSEHSSRSGKYFRAFADEYAHFERSEATLAALIPACPAGLCLGSTPGRSGRNNAFGRIACADPDQEGKHFGFKKLTLHWSMHPLRNKEWFNRETAALTKEEVAREYEIGYDSAIAGRVYPELSRETHVGQYPYDETLPLYLSADHGLANEHVLMWQLHEMDGEKQYWIVDEFIGGVRGFGKKMSPWALLARLNEKLADYPYELKFSNAGRTIEPRQIADFFADPRGQDDNVAVQNRKTDDTRLTSFWAVYRDHGYQPRGDYSKVADGVQIFQRWVEGGQLRINAPCIVTIESLLNYQYRTDRETGEVLDQIKKDAHSHGCDAARYFALGMDRMRGIVTTEPEYVEVWITSRTGGKYPVYMAQG